MERFTKKVDGVWTASCEYGSPPYPLVTQEVIDRLAAYEDTGLAPEEVQAMRWIPVEERLPEKSGEYLIFTDEKEIYAMEFDEDVGDKGEFGRWKQQYSNGGWAGSDWATAEDITHWMPLPPSPQILASTTKGGKEK